MPQDNLWLSCDHTFHTVANIGLCREEDGAWTKQYKGLFCILNSKAKLCRGKLLSLFHLTVFKNRFNHFMKGWQAKAKMLKSFSLTIAVLGGRNCSPFLEVKWVLLDIYHAVQRISTKLSKHHPFHSQCVHDLSLVFRDPTDQGSVRTLETPAPTVLVDNLKKFLRKWKDVDHEGQKLITPNVCNG